ncbi:TonB-dependent receptor [Flavilitoribacter nigricans]|uniref:TonB-dependent receptor n=1 Tax=Flavilitoribacter nigricans (strain ATCC 23147 / DSM 23189 / NBRC 102662 / NCIMB 1420 / SS-2) TaxID=1122177 RepID=A0A2D0NEZ5_FLAN2|nr:TonB-dependent receptor [Flavilitoribacter nigricans]PHN07055.1 TonB-dependent receptor [Flavilitoribacter nigricans DSM 23189 = NBRC 102662]
MKQTVLALLFAALALGISAQTAGISGKLTENSGSAVPFANVVLYRLADSALVKVETTDESGVFRFRQLPADRYRLEATYVGFANLNRSDIELKAGQDLELGTLTFASQAVELETATVRAQRVLVEVKPDRTVFNVEGTINSAGGDGMSLLRKAPGVTVDNNDNINVLGRSGVLLYVDGKRLPLTGQDLTNYLQNLSAEQIDRIDIITNPGARYEAEGNAGIIDIRLKRDKSMGSNGSLSLSSSQGRYHRSSLNASGNYRNKGLSLFATAGATTGEVFNNMNFRSFQNGLVIDESNRIVNSWQNFNVRMGADLFLGKHHTIGALFTAQNLDGERRLNNRMGIASQTSPEVTDSVLIANNFADNRMRQSAYNLNYRFDNGKGQTLNIDADYGRYRTESERLQPNLYYDANEQVVLTEIINFFDTPTEIDISTLKLDYNTGILGGKLGLGGKLSQVVTDNNFGFYDVLNNVNQFNDFRSNRFKYDERVYAGYFSFDRALGKKWNFTLGLRAEQTDATGDLQAYRPELQEPPVELNYLNWFPNAGLTWKVAEQHTLALAYGRRINRPDYNVLNPFNNQLSQLSYEKGNPFLRPEIVNNLELGYTLAYRYNFKLAYSRTTDQITRLIAPDDVDPRASFITWENLSEQKIYSLNISAPVQMTKGWNAYFNLSGSHLDNQADYGNGAVVDVQAWTYNIFQQHTLDLPAGFKGEVSGWYSGPGVWGGVFRYESSWSLNLGLQKKFLGDRLNAKLSVNDLFYESGWDGYSEFNGLYSVGFGRFDSRRVALSLSYNFGNENVKSRRRQTGLEEESNRLGE